MTAGIFDRNALTDGVVYCRPIVSSRNIAASIAPSTPPVFHSRFVIWGICRK